jgi:hypothetical protein
VVVDEVQDMTTVQLDVILRSLARPGQFILCGDANQIVHPNFFSWSKLKSFFHTDGRRAGPAGAIKILTSNYRNSTQVTELANRILKLKTARFGSVDRESHYLVQSTAERPGGVLLLDDDETTTSALNRSTRLSTRFAVIVLEAGHKAEAKKQFDTPLVFSVQEAKGLEYDNIVLFNVVSASRERFGEIARGVEREDLLATELRYGRAKDKTDKSLEIYKFHINALYVAITRAIDTVYLVEGDPEHRLFDVLGLKVARGPLELAEEESSLETWRREARRLELQGKEEQAEQIRTQILKLQPVPWQVLEGAELAALRRRALDDGDKRSKLLLFEYALTYQDGAALNELARRGFNPARQPDKGIKQLNQKYFFAYDVRNPDHMLREVDRYGVDFRNVFNQTPLMIAARFGNADHVDRLVEAGADTSAVNNAGMNAFQIALEQACSRPEYAQARLEAVYERLEPPELVVRSGDRLVKLDNHSMEFLIVNLMIAMFYTHLGDRAAHGAAGYTSGDFVEALDAFPTTLVPQRRKARAYISSILSKNEVQREDRYNRRLFRRLRHGHYVLDPQLAIRIGEAWRDVYDLLSLDALGYHRGGEDDAYTRYLADRVDGYARVRLEAFRWLVAQAARDSSADLEDEGQ